MDHDSLLTNKVPEMRYSEIEDVAPRVLSMQSNVNEESKQGFVVGVPG
jgi:hypothetical protein